MSACSPPRCCTTARTREDNAEAQRLLDRAIALDPNYAHAHAWKACVLGQTWVYGWCDGSRRHLASRWLTELRDRAGARRQRQRRAPHPRRGEPDARRPRQGGLPPGAGARAQSQLRPDRRAAGRVADLARAAGRGDRVDQEGDAPQPLPSRALLEPPRPRAISSRRQYAEAVEAFARITRPDHTHHAFLAATFAQMGNAVARRRACRRGGEA